MFSPEIIQPHVIEQNSKMFPVHAVKEYGRNRCIRIPEPVKQEAGWATETIWSFWRTEKTLAFATN